MSAPTTNIPVAIPAGASSGAPRASSRAPSPAASPGIPGARGLAGRLLHGTPGRMRLFGLLGVVAAVLLGAVCANALLASEAAVERAANNSAQVVRAQSIHVDLLRADAVATNAFLVGGLESPESRASYEGAMAGSPPGSPRPPPPSPPTATPSGCSRSACRRMPPSSSRPDRTTGSACPSGRSTSPRPVQACAPMPSRS